MDKAEHVYTVEVTVIGAQPGAIEQPVKELLDADCVLILGEKVFPDISEG